MKQLHSQHSFLKSWKWFDFTGKDCADFLQRLCSSSAQDLPPGQGSASSFLQASGHFRCAFYLWRLGPEHFGIEIDTADGEEFQNLQLFIDTYHFSEDIHLKERNNWQVSWLFSDRFPQPPNSVDFSQDHALLCHHDPQEWNQGWISLWQKQGSSTDFDFQLGDWQNCPSLSNEEILQYQIDAMYPRVGKEITSRVNPLESHWSRGVSPSKGCYPGQEVLEKILAKSVPAQRLVKIRCRSEASVAEANPLLFTAEKKEAGQITSIAATTGDQASSTGLARIKKIYLQNKQALYLKNGEEVQIDAVAPFK